MTTVACLGCGYLAQRDVQPPNIGTCPTCGKTLAQQAAAGLTARQAYNVVTDVGTGVNVRWKDNFFQALFIVACIPLGSAAGYLVTPGRADGPIFGGAIGLLVGLFGSGIFLMIYRAIQHARRKHD